MAALVPSLPSPPISIILVLDVRPFGRIWRGWQEIRKSEDARVRQCVVFVFWSLWVVSDSSVTPWRLICPWDSPGKNTGVSFHFLLQEIFPTQGLNPHLLSWQVDSLPLSHQGITSRFRGLKNQTCYLLVSVARNLDMIWLDGSGSRSLTQLQSVGQGCGWRLHWGRIQFQVQPCALGPDSAPTEGGCTEDLGSLQVVGWRPHSVPCPGASPLGIYNSITLAILSLSEKSHLGPVHSHGLGSHLRNCLPPSGCHSFILFLFSGHHSWAYMLIQLYCSSRGEPHFYDLVRNQVVLKGKMNSLKSDSASHHSPC